MLDPTFIDIQYDIIYRFKLYTSTLPLPGSHFHSRPSCLVFVHSPHGPQVKMDEKNETEWTWVTRKEHDWKRIRIKMHESESKSNRKACCEPVHFWGFDTGLQGSFFTGIILEFFWVDPVHCFHLFEFKLPQKQNKQKTNILKEVWSSLIALLILVFSCFLVLWQAVWSAVVSIAVGHDTT